jgi:hypothetical protein
LENSDQHTDAWGRLIAQLRPSPHIFTNL